MRVIYSITAALAVLLAGCAVGPDFKKPAAPEVSGYTPAPLSPTSGTTNVAGGEPQHFVSGSDIPGEWWTLFHSKPLNDLIELSLSNNPTIKAAQAALKVAQGKYPGPEGQLLSQRRGSLLGGPPEDLASRFRPHPTPGRCISASIRRKSACPTCRTSLASTAGRWSCLKARRGAGALCPGRDPYHPERERSRRRDPGSGLARTD